MISLPDSLKAVTLAILVSASAFAQTPGDVSPLNATVASLANQVLSFSASYSFDTDNSNGYPTEGSPEMDVSIGTSGCTFALQWAGGSTSPSFSVSDSTNCQVSLASAYYYQGALSFNVNIDFVYAVVGQSFPFYEQAVDNASNQSSGWWVDPGASITISPGSQGSPQTGSVAPANGSGLANQMTTLTFTASDPNGWGANNEVDVLITPNYTYGSYYTSTNACRIAFIPGDVQSPYLFSDDLSSWSGIWYDGRTNALNSQCQLIGSGFSYAYSGTGNTTLTLKFSVEFFPPMVGQNFVDEMVSDQWGTTGNLSVIGYYTVVGNPIVTTNCIDLPLAVVGTPYSMPLQVQGSRSPYSWSMLSGSLPPGMYLTSDGTMKGAPTQTGTFGLFAITVSDGSGNWAQLPLTCSLTAMTITSMDTTTGSPPPSVVMPATQMGLRRGGAFDEDSNGNGLGPVPNDADPAVTFAPPSGVLAGDIPVAGDWTGSGSSKVGFYRPSSGTWWLDANGNGVWDSGDFQYQFGGISGDVPVVGDWSGIPGTKLRPNGYVHKDCIGVFRDGFLWVLDLNCNGSFDNVPTDAAFPYGGINGDIPVVGKWRSTSVTRAGLVRYYAPNGVPQGNPFYWVPDNGNAYDGYTVAAHQPDTTHSFAFGGEAGDVFVTGDWNSTGVTAAGVYRNGLWVLDQGLPGDAQSQHAMHLTVSYGGSVGDVPLTGHWADIAVTYMTTSLPSVVVGGSYSPTVKVVGGSQFYGWSYTGTLPPGVSFSGGVFSGTATIAGSYGFTVSVWDTAVPATKVMQSFTINVTDFTMGTPMPSSISIVPGASAVTIAGSIQGLYGFTGPVAMDYGSGLSVAGPAGVSVSGPSPVPFTFTIQAPSGTAANVYTITIKGNDANHTVSVKVIVTGPPGVTMSSPMPSPIIVSSNQNVTFTQTITAVNGFTGTVGFSSPIGVLCWGGEFSMTAVTLTAANPSQTVTGTIIPSAGRSNSTVVNQCEVDAINAAFPASNQKIFSPVPVQVFTGGTFTVSGPTTPFTLYINSNGTVPATPVTLQLNPVNGFRGPVNFTAPPGFINITGAASVTSDASIPVQVLIQATATTPPSATPVPIYIQANGQLVLTLYAIIQASTGSTFSITPTPSDRNGNALGAATYLLSVTGPANSTTQLSLIQSELPSGTTYSFSSGASTSASTGAVTGSGGSVLSFNSPQAVAKFKFHAKGTNGSATLMPELSFNPMAGSTTAPAVMIDPWGAIPTCNPTFVWDSGVGVTQYQLLVGSTFRGTNYFGSSSTGGGITTNQYAQVPLPSNGGPVYASIGSEIGGVWQPYIDYFYPYGCTVPPPDIPLTPEVAYLLSAQVATVRNDGVGVQYSYIVKPDGVDVNLIPVGSTCLVGGPAGVTASVTGHATFDGGIWITFTANSSVSPGGGSVYGVKCPFQHPTLGTQYFQIADGVTVTDPTPVITDVTPHFPPQPPVPMGQPITLTITGQNFGPQPSDQSAASALLFCPDPASSCNQGSPVTFTHEASWWTNSSIVVSVKSSASGSYDVQVVRGPGGSGNGFYASQSSARSVPHIAMQVALAAVTININNTATNSDDVAVLGRAQPLQAQVILVGAPATVQLSIMPAGRVSIDQPSLALTSGIPATINITPLQQSNAPNDVRIVATLNGITIGQASMTVVTLAIPNIRRDNTPTGMPDRIPPRVDTPITVTLQPDLSGSGQQVTLATFNTNTLNNQLNGDFTINGASTLNITKTTNPPVNLRGTAQTAQTGSGVPTAGEHGGGNAGHLQLIAQIAAQTVVSSSGFSVAAIPYNYTDTYISNKVDDGYVGILVQDGWSSDSGFISDLDWLNLAEVVEPQPGDSGSLAGEMTKTTGFFGGYGFSTDQHAESSGKTTVGFVKLNQVIVIADRRTGAWNIPMANSGFEITQEIKVINGGLNLEITKKGADVTAEGYHSGPGSANIDITQPYQ